MYIIQAHISRNQQRLSSSALLLVFCLLLASCTGTGSGLSLTPTEMPPGQSPTPVATSTLTRPDMDATKVARYEQQRQEWEAMATRIANGTPIVYTPIPIRTAAPRPSPVLGIYNGCADPDPYYTYRSCWAGRQDNEYLFVSSGALKSEPAQGMVRVYTTTLEQRTRGPEQTYTTPLKAGLVLIISSISQRLTLQAEDGTLFYFDVPTRQWVTPLPRRPFPRPLLAAHALSAVQFAGPGNCFPAPLVCVSFVGQPYLCRPRQICYKAEEQGMRIQFLQTDRLKKGLAGFALLLISISLVGCAKRPGATTAPTASPAPTTPTTQAYQYRPPPTWENMSPEMRRIYENRRSNTHRRPHSGTPGDNWPRLDPTCGYSRHVRRTHPGPGDPSGWGRPHCGRRPNWASLRNGPVQKPMAARDRQPAGQSVHKYLCRSRKARSSARTVAHESDHPRPEQENRALSNTAPCRSDPGYRRSRGTANPPSRGRHPLLLRRTHSPMGRPAARTSPDTSSDINSDTPRYGRHEGSPLRTTTSGMGGNGDKNC